MNEKLTFDGQDVTYQAYLQRCDLNHVSPYDVVTWLQLKVFTLEDLLHKTMDRVNALEQKSRDESGDGR